MKIGRKYLIGVVAIAFFLTAFFLTFGLKQKDLGYTFTKPNDLARVARVIDGDTVELEGEVAIRVRYMGVDAPEFDQPFGLSATELNKKLVLGKKVKLEYGEENFDDYGRLLAYVWVKDVMINEKLVEEGYARISYIPEKGRPKYLDRLKKAEKKAKSLQKGIWSKKK